MTSISDHYTSRGWKSFPNQFKPNAVSHYAPTTERIGLPDCECNDKSPGMYLYEYDPILSANAPLRRSYEVELVGERNGIWLKFQAYSLHTVAEIEQGIAAVKNAWMANPKAVCGETP